jgi:hypothetical protein
MQYKAFKRIFNGGSQVYDLPPTSGTVFESVVLNVARHRFRAEFATIDFEDLAKETLKASSLFPCFCPHPPVVNSQQKG